MKIRNGFVSNSSSSSFICNYCGYIESGYDSFLSDFEMCNCENGHTFHVHECKEQEGCSEIDIYSKEFINDVITMLRNELEKIKDKEYIEYIVDEYNNYINLLMQYLEDKEVDLEDYEYYITNEWGVPEKYCPVCVRKHKMEQDVDYEKYKELYEKFKGITPDGSK